MRLGQIIILLLLTGQLFGQPIQRIAIHPGKIDIIAMDVLNSPFEEKSLCLTPDGKQLYFHTKRGGQLWSYTYKGAEGQLRSDGDIWFSQKIKGEWQAPKPLPYKINTSNTEDEPFVLRNARILYYQSWNFQWESTEGPYYRVKYRRGDWRKVQGLGGNITDFFRRYSQTDGMCVSPDEKLFIVAASQPSDPDMNLFLSRKATFGWSKFEQLDLSTLGDERTVFLAADGKTLYFASNGYAGFGGLDIYKTVLSSDGTFGAIINLGSPINSNEDDYGFVISEDGNEAYFIRHGDIYRVSLQAADPLIKPLQ